jgi:hypothetical protein
MPSTSTMNANINSTSRGKPKVLYICSHCGRHGHKIEFCFRLAKQQRRERVKHKSNFRTAHIIPHEIVTPHMVHRVKQMPFVTKNINNARPEFLHKNKGVVATFVRRVSEYWIPKCYSSNPGTEASTLYVSM